MSVRPPASTSASESPSPTKRPLSGTVLGRLLDRVHIDFVPVRPQPSWARWVVATVIALAGSLAADAVLVAVGKAVFPSTADFPHFQFEDYSKLTVIGVVVACVGWPVVTRVSSQPRWVFLRAAVVVTLVLLVPDLYIWHTGEPARGVLVLMVMHVAIALVTYNALVRLAPAGGAADRTVSGHGRA